MDEAPVLLVLKLLSRVLGGAPAQQLGALWPYLYPSPSPHPYPYPLGLPLFLTLTLLRRAVARAVRGERIGARGDLVAQTRGPMRARAVDRAAGSPLAANPNPNPNLNPNPDPDPDH